MTTFKKTATFSFLGGLGSLTGDTKNKDEFALHAATRMQDCREMADGVGTRNLKTEMTEH